MHRRHRRRHHQTLSPAAPDLSTVSQWAERKRRKISLLQGQREEEQGYAGPSLTEDIWCHIHSLLPLRDAARAACVSHVFRWSWRHLPNLTFSEGSLGLNRKTSRKKYSRDFNRTVDQILKNHSSKGVKTLEFRMSPHYKARDHQRIDTWLQMASTPGIEKVTLSMSSKDGSYKLPCSFLSHGKGGSIRHLELANCSLCPTTRPWCLSNLMILDLNSVQLTGDGLWCLLSSTTVLERLLLEDCTGIVCLKIPGALQRLGYMEVVDCDDLQAVESKAPNLSRFNFLGNLCRTKISLGEALRVKNLHLDCSISACYTRAELASNNMPVSEIVNVLRETLDEPAEISSKSVHLERLYIAGIGRTPFYMNVKYCSLVSRFGASHSVEDFVSSVSSQLADHVSFCSELQGAKKSAWSMQKEKGLVEEACCMLKAWLS